MLCFRVASLVRLRCTAALALDHEFELARLMNSWFSGTEGRPNLSSREQLWIPRHDRNSVLQFYVLKGGKKAIRGTMQFADSTGLRVVLEARRVPQDGASRTTG